MKLSELFKDPTDCKQAQSRLNRKLTGETLVFSGVGYRKTAADEIEELPELEPEAMARKPPPGRTEMNLAAELVESYSSRYRMVRMAHKNKSVLHIVNQRGEIAPVDQSLLTAELRAYLGERVLLKTANAVVTRTLDDLQTKPGLVIPESAVATLLFNNTDTARFCYKRLAIDNTRLDACPTRFKDLCDHIITKSGAEILALWIGSLLDPDSIRVQYLCLYGGGRNGKSTLLDALARVLGSAALGMTSQDFMSRFGLADAANKRLLLFDDNNNASFMSSGDFKRVTGSESLRIEPKGVDRYFVKNNLKILIATNRMPNLRGDDADLRRNIFLEMKKYAGATGDGERWVADFMNEAPDILRYCYTVYCEHKQRTGSSHIPIPKVEEGSENIVYSLSDQAQAEDFIAENFFMADDSAKVTAFTKEGRTPRMVTPSSMLDKLARTKLSKGVCDAIRERLHQDHPVTRIGKGPRIFKDLYWNDPVLHVVLSK